MQHRGLRTKFWITWDFSSLSRLCRSANCKGNDSTASKHSLHQSRAAAGSNDAQIFWIIAFQGKAEKWRTANHSLSAAAGSTKSDAMIKAL